MAEFEVGEHQYISTKIDARTQFHVARRLAPVLTSFRQIIVASAERTLDTEESENTPISEMIDSWEPLVDAIAKMPDDHVDYVLDACLKVCKRAIKSPSGEITGWANVWNATAKKPQFDDIDLKDMLSIVQNVLTENLSGFFDELPS